MDETEESRRIERVDGVEKEYLGTVTVNAPGQQKISYKVYMPTVGDMLNVDTKANDFMYRIGAKAIGVSLNDYMKWSLADGMKVINLVSKGLERL